MIDNPGDSFYLRLLVSDSDSTPVVSEGFDACSGQHRGDHMASSDLGELDDQINEVQRLGVSFNSTKFGFISK